MEVTPSTFASWKKINTIYTIYTIDIYYIICYYCIIGGYPRYMKTYTFFYYDSLEDCKNVEFKSYVVSSPRFDSAYKSFSHFLSFNESDYIDFVYTYNVFNGFRTQVRSFSYNDILHLIYIKDKHNADFWKKKYD